MPRKKSTFGPSGYQGYKVSIQLVRDGKYRPVALPDSNEVYEFMKDLENFDRETFYSLHLNAKGNLVACEEIAKGSSTQCVVNPAEVYKSALLSSAQSIILVHNHPSGDPQPSVDDTRITDRLVECGDILGIQVLDSIIIGHDDYYSYRDKDRLKKPKG